MRRLDKWICSKHVWVLSKLLATAFDRHNFASKGALRTLTVKEKLVAFPDQHVDIVIRSQRLCLNVQQQPQVEHMGPKS